MGALARSGTLPRKCYPRRTNSRLEVNFPYTSSVRLGRTRLDHSTVNANLDAVSSLEKPSSDISQGTSLNASSSQGELVQIKVEEPSPSEDKSFDISQGTSSNYGRPRGEFAQTGPSRSPFVLNWWQVELYNDRAKCALLLQASIKGDWPAAKAFLDQFPDYVRAPITEERGTALHNAAVAQRTSFIKELLKLMNSEDLELTTKEMATALLFAAQSGIVRIAKQLVKINKKPLLIQDCLGMTPFHIAAYLGHTNMVSYLFSVTPHEQLTTDDHIQLLLYTTHYDLYDIALIILEILKEAAPANDSSTWGWNALEELAKKPFAIGGESQLSFWKRLLNSWFKGTCNKALMKTLSHKLVEGLWEMVGIQVNKFSPSLARSHMTLIFEAAKAGNVEFLIILIRSYPDLIWQLDEKKKSIFHIAIFYRHESVFNLIYEIGTNKYSLASLTTLDTKENMLHLAGQLAPPDRLSIVSGAALQMQREMLWFKEIEKIVPPSYVNMKNSNGKTPKEIFIETHTNLQKDGERWMKDTANYCMIVATLIATVIFAAAFTVPGGSNQEGNPIFLRSSWFMVFFISDAIALCSSSTSIIIFLSILTARYTEEDFYKSLPSKLLFGLATLFISVAGMMVAFCATWFLVYNSVRAWTPVVVITSASIPVTSFVVLHCKLLVDTFLSTYESRFLFQPNKHRLF